MKNDTTENAPNSSSVSRPPDTRADNAQTTRPPSYGGSVSGRSRERIGAGSEDPFSTHHRRNFPLKASAFIGSDSMTRWLMFGVGGIGVVLALIVGGWALFGKHPTGIPVLGPPPFSVRERPLNPGGLQVLGGVDADISTDTGSGVHLAPAPEQPHLDAMERRYGAEPYAGVQHNASPNFPAQTNEAPAPSQSEGMTPSVAAPASSDKSDIVQEKKALSWVDDAIETPTPASSQHLQQPPSGAQKPPQRNGSKAPPDVAPSLAPVQKQPAVLSRGVTGEMVPAGHFEVQLAALDTQKEALHEWTRLRQRAPRALASRRPRIVRSVVRGRIFYRLRIAGFARVSQAQRFCAELHSARVPCSVATY